MKVLLKLSCDRSANELAEVCLSLPNINQSGAWYAEAVDLAVIRKSEKIKTLQGVKKFKGWRSRRNFQWGTQGMSCKRSVKANL